MGSLVFGMNVSLDGYVDHMAFGPGAGLFEHFIEQTRGLAGSLYGRGLYEVMRYWDEEHAEWGAAERAFAQAWRRQPKWVVSDSLTSVGPNATLHPAEDLAVLAADLRARLDGRIDVGGTRLAASLSAWGLVDEYQLYLHPAVVGRGTPYFRDIPPPLQLSACDEFGEGVVRLRYVPRGGAAL